MTKQVNASEDECKSVDGGIANGDSRVPSHSAPALLQTRIHRAAFPPEIPTDRLNAGRPVFLARTPIQSLDANTRLAQCSSTHRRPTFENPCAHLSISGRANRAHCVLTLAPVEFSREGGPAGPSGH